MVSPLIFLLFGLGLAVSGGALVYLGWRQYAEAASAAHEAAATEGAQPLGAANETDSEMAITAEEPPPARARVPAQLAVGGALLLFAVGFLVFALALMFGDIFGMFRIV